MVKKNEHTARSGCPIACGLDLVGDHWTLIIVRDLMLMGRHEFTELLESEEGISTNILSDRLKKLCASGIICAVAHPDSKKKKLYYLTAKGKDLIYVLFAIGRWSAKHLPGTVMLPEELMAEFSEHPDGMVAGVLDKLARWESEIGIDVQAAELVNSV